MATKSINFRGTSGYVTDGAAETYCLGDTYPTTRNGQTFGWVSGLSGAADRSVQDARLSGINYTTNTAAQGVFRIDLDQAGLYKVTIAAGDPNFEQYHFIEVLDNDVTQLIYVDDVNTLTNNFADAQGTSLTYANWLTSNVTENVTFTTTSCYIRIGDPDNTQAASSTISHITLEPLSFTLLVDAGSLPITGKEITFTSPTLSEAPTTWFNGEWWRSPFWGTGWWAAAGSITFNVDKATVSITGKEITFTTSGAEVTLSIDAGTVPITGKDIKLSVPLYITAGTVAITGKDIATSVEFSGDPFTLSTSGTFDGKGISIGIDVAVNYTNGAVSGVGYKILEQIDTDTLLLDGIFGTPPQTYSIQRQLSETTVPARIELEFNGTEWVLISNTPSGL